MAAELPSELLDLTFRNFCHPEPHHFLNLFACSLVCKSWSSIANRLLGFNIEFKEFVIDSFILPDVGKLAILIAEAKRLNLPYPNRVRATIADMTKMLADPYVNCDTEFPGQSALLFFDVVSVAKLQFGEATRSAQSFYRASNPDPEHFLKLLATKCTHLSSLRLFDPNLGDPRAKKWLMDIVRLNAPSLKTLEIQSVELFSDCDLPIVRLCTRLELFDVTSAPHTSEFLSLAIEKLPNLLTACVGTFASLYPYSVNTVLSTLSISCPKLDRLVILNWHPSSPDSISSISIHSLAHLLFHCRHLTEVSLWKSSAVDDSIFHLLSITTPGLRALELKHIPILTCEPVDNSFHLATLVHIRDWLWPQDAVCSADEVRWPILEVLEIGWCPRVSPKIVPRLLKGCPALRRLALPQHVAHEVRVQEALVEKGFAAVGGEDGWTRKDGWMEEP